MKTPNPLTSLAAALALGAALAVPSAAIAVAPQVLLPTPRPSLPTDAAGGIDATAPADIAGGAAGFEQA